MLERLWQARTVRYTRYTIETLLVNALIFSMLYQLIVYLANRRFWRQMLPVPPDHTPSISVVVPLRGKSLDTLALLHLIAVTRPTDEYEMLLVIEDESDPAYAIASEIADSYPRMARVVISGPVGSHVGKLHNLNAGVTAARGDLIALIDANTQMNAALWHAALAVMADDASHDTQIGAAFAPPVAIEPETRGQAPFPAGGEMLITLHTNHARTAEIPLMAIYDRLRTLASGFIVLRRSALEAAGGMLHLLDEASEEVALARVITEAGYRIAAIPVPAYVVAEPASVNDATAHIQRKLITLRATDPARFAGLLFANPLTVGSLLGFITEREGRWWGRRTWWIFIWLRLAVAYELDRIRLGRAFVWPAYAQLFMLDTFVTPVLWARALVQRWFWWRGRWYRIVQGGKVERVE